MLADAAARTPRSHWWPIAVIAGLLLIIVTLVTTMVYFLEVRHSHQKNEANGSSFATANTSTMEESATIHSLHTQAATVERLTTSTTEQSNGFTTVVVPLTMTHEVTTTPQQASTTLYVPTDTSSTDDPPPDSSSVQVPQRVTGFDPHWRREHNMTVRPYLYPRQRTARPSDKSGTLAATYDRP